MKRFLSILLALVMVFALCACGGGSAEKCAPRWENKHDFIKAPVHILRTGAFLHSCK